MLMGVHICFFSGYCRPADSARISKIQISIIIRMLMKVHICFLTVVVVRRIQHEFPPNPIFIIIRTLMMVHICFSQGINIMVRNKKEQMKTIHAQRTTNIKIFWFIYIYFNVLFVVVRRIQHEFSFGLGIEVSKNM